jgi:hypothetical protein
MSTEKGLLLLGNAIMALSILVNELSRERVSCGEGDSSVHELSFA